MRITTGSAGKRGSNRHELAKALKIILVLFILWVPISWALADFLVIEKPVERPDALVVLGGSAEYIDRTALAASLFKEGRARHIIVTNDGEKGGWSETEQRNPYFVERARSSLIAGGVPPDAVLVPPQSTSSTDEEAKVVLNFAAERGFSAILLVTSPYHTRRTLLIFESQRERDGSGCTIGISTYRGGRQDPSSYLWWLSARGIETVISEYAKLVYFGIAK